MAPESALIGTVLLLAASVALQVVAWVKVRPDVGRWPLPLVAALGARIAAALLVVATAVLIALEEGGWSTLSVRQVAIDLALATLLVHLILTAWVRVNAAGPVVELVAIGLALAGLAAPGASAPAGSPALPLVIQWILTLLGAGAVAAAGSTALLLGIRAVLIMRVRRAAWRLGGPGPLRATLHHFLYQATALGVVSLGAGLTAGLWWAWQTEGSLTSGDPREAWVVASALLAAGSLWAARLGRQSGRWAAMLALTAAGVAVTGLLAGFDLHQVLTL